VCQGQSINVFLPADIDKWDLLMLHWTAWEKGVKSLYYCRSKSIQRAEAVGAEKGVKAMKTEKTDYEECLACQ
jgi:ribonucleoside-diphosphate reductase alpha chain